jgi:hypothetical protein
MPVKHTWLLLPVVKFGLQMGTVTVPGALLPALDGAFLPFLPALGFAFFGLLAAPFFVLFMAPVAARLTAFFGVPLDFFFFFFKILLLSSNPLDGKASMLPQSLVDLLLPGPQRTYGCEDFISC